MGVRTASKRPFSSGARKPLQQGSRSVSGAQGNCHFATGHSTTLAGCDASFHAPEPTTIICALSADFGALGADVGVVGRTQEHEMGSGAANLGTRHHQGKMRLCHVLAAHLEAVVHRHGQAGPITGQASVDARLHLGVDHRNPLILCLSLSRVLPLSANC